jgi:hypothetical protein
MSASSILNADRAAIGLIPIGDEGFHFNRHPELGKLPGELWRERQGPQEVTKSQGPIILLPLRHPAEEYFRRFFAVAGYWQAGGWLFG